MDEEHHVGETHLLVLPTDFIACFPIDYMHCICLGVVRKLLNSWLSGPLHVRLGNNLAKQISDHLVQLRIYLPSKFNRKPRPLDELARWKATEFRTFLLHLGPVVLKNKLALAVYEHFMLLHCAITILVSDNHISKFIASASEMLNTFVTHCSKLYGQEYYVYNIHMLCHLTDDVQLFGCLDNFSAFPFENFLGQLKKMVKSPTNLYNRFTDNCTKLTYAQ